jgi:pyridoxamine 5'-phosphate oxidase
MPTDPVLRFRRWFEQARRAGIELPEAMALATADVKGRPSVRFVLMKEIDQRGLVFYTNEGSQKGRELGVNPYAAVAFHWDRLHRQVRIEGRVERIAAAEANAYWKTRPRASQLAALASEQSEGLTRREVLIARWRKLAARHRGREVPRPAEWTGFRIVPESFEFWTHREHRLHDRELFVRSQRGWRRKLLQP